MTEIAIKKTGEKSETWLSAITAVGALVTAYTSSIEGAAKWVALGVCVLLAGVFAFFKTPLASGDGTPGVKTKAFWTSVLIIVASVATAIAEADIEGVPARVTQIAGMVAAALVAAGYNVWRYRKKVANRAAAEAATGSRTMETPKKPEG